MTKLEAIQKILNATGVPDSSKLVGIRQVLESDEKSAKSIAGIYSTSTKDFQRRQKAKAR